MNKQIVSVSTKVGCYVKAQETCRIDLIFERPFRPGFFMVMSPSAHFFRLLSVSLEEKTYLKSDVGIPASAFCWVDAKDPVVACCRIDWQGRVIQVAEKLSVTVLNADCDGRNFDAVLEEER